MLLDPETYAAAPGVERLLGPPGLKTELFSCLVETNTEVCETAAEALAELAPAAGGGSRAPPLARGLVVAATGSHPFSRPEEQDIVREPRYLALLEERPAARSQLVCGLHVHVGMDELRALPRDARVRPPVVAGGPRRLAQLAVSRGREQRPAVGARRPAPRAAAGRRAAAPGAGAAGRRRSSRPAATTRGSGGTCARIPGSGRSRCGCRTSRRASGDRLRSPRSCRRCAPRRRLGLPPIAARSRRLGRMRPPAARRSLSCWRSSSRPPASSTPWELVESLREPAEALRQLEVGERAGLTAVAADLVARTAE